MSTNDRSARKFFQATSNLQQHSGIIIGLIIATALIFFEMFNYSTTDYALRDLLGNLKFAGIRWATLLSIAFCGIDFAGIARLFTSEQGNNEHTETWYLFGAWLIAATMNAALTWWGVSMAILSHPIESSAVVDPGIILKIVPIFVSIMVWVIRILIIGSISIAGDRLLWGNSQHKTRTSTSQSATRSSGRSAPGAAMPRTALARPKSSAGSTRTLNAEHSYHNLSTKDNSQSQSGSSAIRRFYPS